MQKLLLVTVIQQQPIHEHVVLLILIYFRKHISEHLRFWWHIDLVLVRIRVVSVNVSVIVDRYILML